MTSYYLLIMNDGGTHVTDIALACVADDSLYDESVSGLDAQVVRWSAPHSLLFFTLVTISSVFFRAGFGSLRQVLVGNATIAGIVVCDQTSARVNTVSTNPAHH
jgi:hypothetical protein